MQVRPPLMMQDGSYSGAPSQQEKVARELYERIAGLPLVCPHGHVNPRLFSDPGATFGTPADLFIIPDHYVIRMLYSQGIAMERLGVPRVDGGEVETDHRAIWRLFCANFHLFRGTPSGLWLTHELGQVFGINEKPSADNAERLYDAISQKLAQPEFSPRALFERFNIEVLNTTDAVSDNLEQHRAIRASGWHGRVLPTLRTDGVINLDARNWQANLRKLGEAAGVEITDFRSYVRALEQRRDFFRSMGATATDHGVPTPFSAELSPAESETIFQRALRGQAGAEDAARFSAHMLMEMARMSIEDGLVMQIHPGAVRNHNVPLFERFGPDRGGDIPQQTEFTRNLRPLLNRYGNDSRLTLIVFSLDETAYSRELAPLAGHYPALKLGPPWWFHDSPNGMARYFDQVMETAGLYNTAGFNDDTRAFCSIPIRHDTWRRASAHWVAGLVVQRIVDMDDAHEMAGELAVGLARRAYRL